jgi:hypothetical protein
MKNSAVSLNSKWNQQKFLVSYAEETISYTNTLWLVKLAVWQDVGVLPQFRAKALQYEMASQGISTIQKIHTLLSVHKHILVLRRSSDSCWFLPNDVTIIAQYYNILLFNNVYIGLDEIT